MTLTDAAYFAGIMDGEGTFGAYFQGRRRNRQGVTPVFQVVNTNEAIVRKVAEVARSVGIQRDPKLVGKTKKEKPIWVWSSRSHREIRQLIPPILGYLVGKREQAELLLRITQAAPYWPRTPDWVIEVAARIRELNQKGNAEPDRDAVGGSTGTSGVRNVRHSQAPCESAEVMGTCSA